MKNIVFWHINSQFVPHSRHYVSATEPSRLMLCKIWGFHSGDYEECRLLGCCSVWLLRTDVSEERIAYIVTPKMEAMRSSDTSVLIRATRRNILEDGILFSCTHVASAFPLQYAHTTVFLIIIYFSSLHFWWFAPPLHFTWCITCLTVFLKLLGLQESVPKASAGNSLQSCIVPFIKDYFLTAVFCFLLLILLSWSTLFR
jgi:hypothetical protein